MLLTAHSFSSWMDETQRRNRSNYSLKNRSNSHVRSYLVKWISRSFQQTAQRYNICFCGIWMGLDCSGKTASRRNGYFSWCIALQGVTIHFQNCSASVGPETAITVRDIRALLTIQITTPIHEYCCVVVWISRPRSHFPARDEATVAYSTLKVWELPFITYPDWRKTISIFCVNEDN